MFCLSPPLSAVPQGEWVCPDCMSSEFDSYTFQASDDYTLEEFQQTASDFETAWFGTEKAAAEATVADKEIEFWRLVEAREDAAEVLYGDHLDTAQVGSGFPTDPKTTHSSSSLDIEQRSSLAEYTNSPWNLNVLPNVSGSLLSQQLVGGPCPVAGMNHPVLDVGMLFSSFSWQIDNHMLYSMSYNHWGAGKRWYGVPGHAAGCFEAVFQAALPGHMEVRPDHPFQLLSMVSPAVLQQAGVPVYAATQEEGTFIVTFPNAYRAGFSTGTSCGEAVNFAAADWLRFAAASGARYRLYHRPCVVSQEILLLRAAKDAITTSAASPPSSSSPLLHYHLARELRRLLKEEAILRAKLWQAGLRKSRKLPSFDEESDVFAMAECSSCHMHPYLSYLECTKCGTTTSSSNKKSTACLYHASNMCGCSMADKCLVFPHTLKELQDLATKIEGRLSSEDRSKIQAIEGKLQKEVAKAASETAKAMTATFKKATTGGNGSSAARRIRLEDVEEGGEHTNTDVEMTEAAAITAITSSASNNKIKEAADGIDIHTDAPLPAYTHQQLATRATAAAANDSTLEALAGFMTEIASGATPSQSQHSSPITKLTASAMKRKRKRDDDGSSPMALPLIRDNGTATTIAVLPVPPVVPYTNRVEDLSDADIKAYGKTLLELVDKSQLWLQASKALLGRKEGSRGDADNEEEEAAIGADLSKLSQEAEEYVWGGLAGLDQPQDNFEEVVKVAQQIKAADKYVSEVAAALRGKPILSHLQYLLNMDPQPFPNPPGLSKLSESLKAAKDWLTRAAPLLACEEAIELRLLESCVSEATRIPVSLPEAKMLKERLIAARKIADAIRIALPSGRESGVARRHSKQRAAVVDGNGTVVGGGTGGVGSNSSGGIAFPIEDAGYYTLADLLSLREQAEEVKVIMPEFAKLSSALDRLETWRMRARTALNVMTQPALEDVRILATEADALPAILPEAEEIRALIDNADSWLREKDSLLKSKAHLKRLRDLLHIGLRLPVAVPDVEELRVSIRKREWEENARKALTSKHTLQGVKEILASASEMGAEDSQLAVNLAKKVIAAEEWDAEATEFMARLETIPKDDEDQRLTLAELESFVNRGNGVGVKTDLHTSVTTMLAAAMIWVARATDCLPAEIREALKAEEGGNGGFGGSVSGGLGNMLMSTDDDDVDGDNEEGDNDNADEEADEALGALRSLACVAGEPSSSKSKKGKKTSSKTKIKQLSGAAAASVLRKTATKPTGIDDTGTTTIPTATTATATVAYIIKKPAGGGGPAKLEVIESLLDEYDLSLVIRHPAAPPLRMLRAAARTWLEKAHPILYEQDYVTDDQMPILTELIQTGRATGVAMEQLEVLEANVEGLEWARTVRALLRKLPPLPDDLNDEVNMEVEEKKGGALAGKKTAVDTDTAGVGKESNGDDKEKEKGACSAPPPPAAPKDEVKTEEEEENEEDDKQSRSPSAKPLPASTLLPPSTEASSASVATRLKLSPIFDHLLKIKSQQEEDGEEVEEVMFGSEEWPTVDRLVKLLDQGDILPLNDESLLKDLQRRVALGREWETKAKSILQTPLPNNKYYYIQATITSTDLVALLAAGEAMKVQSDLSRRLAMLLAAHGEWERGVKERLEELEKERSEKKKKRKEEDGNDGGSGDEEEEEEDGRPPLAVFQQFENTAKNTPITSELRYHIDSTVDAAIDWQENCRRCIAKRNSGLRLDRALECMTASIECAVGQFERRLEVEKRMVATKGSNGSGGGGSQVLSSQGGAEEDEHELYCLCQQPYNVDTIMIACDTCGDWYHMKCVGLTQAAAKTLKKYACPTCSAVRGSLEPLEAAINRLKKTKRPTREELQALLDKAINMPVFIPEQAPLQKALVKFDRWGTATLRAIEVHTSSCLKVEAGKEAIPPLSDGMLNQLCKSSLAIELDATDYAVKIIKLLRSDRWRRRVLTILKPNSSSSTTTTTTTTKETIKDTTTPSSTSSKLSIEMAEKLLAEGPRMEVKIDTDAVGSELKAAVLLTRTWRQKATKLLGSLSQAKEDEVLFSSLATKANALVREATYLPINVDKDVEKLKEQSKLFCLCQQPYDALKPMVGCDYCNDWYHPGCVGLREDEVPEDFQCPTCCMKAYIKYPYYSRLPESSMEALKGVATRINMEREILQQQQQQQQQQQGRGGAGGGGRGGIGSGVLQQQQQQQQLLLQQQQHQQMMHPMAAAAMYQQGGPPTMMMPGYPSMGMMPMFALPQGLTMNQLAMLQQQQQMQQQQTQARQSKDGEKK
jgi:hypothetical protein